MAEQPKNSLKRALTVPLFFVAIMWVVKIVEWIFGYEWYHYGVLPRTVSGLKGIVLMPFLHGDFEHLMSNTLAMVILGMGIFYFYRRIAFRIYAWSILLSGLWVWVAARPHYHIGASGLVYAFASFMFFSGIFRGNFRLLLVSLAIAVLYSGMIWGILPLQPKVSWEGHLFGTIAGLFLAYNYRKRGPKKKQYSWEREGEEEEDDLIRDQWRIDPDAPPAPRRPQRFTIRYVVRKKDPPGNSKS